MKKIYYVKVQFHTGIFMTQRKFFFDSVVERAYFVTEARKFNAVFMVGFGIEHVLSGKEAYAYSAQIEQVIVNGRT
jgi:hypothetical protein